MFHIAAVLRATGTVEQIVRTANALTFVCSHRTVQVVLRLYPSTAAVLTLFDVDCCACAWDGADVRALPRCCLALNRAANVVDPVRDTPSFDFRLLKYASRGFAIAVPGYTGSMAVEELSRPRALASGLARLVQLEAAASIPELTKLFSTHDIDSSTRANRPNYVYPGPEAARISARLEADDPVMYCDNTQGDAYGYNILSSYVPWLAWGCDKPVAHVMMNLLVEPPFPVYWRWAMPRGYIWHDPPADPAGRFRLFRHSSSDDAADSDEPDPALYHGPLISNDPLQLRTAPALLRSPPPRLPWIFALSGDDKALAHVLDATHSPLIAFEYTWVEHTQPDFVQPAQYWKLPRAGLDPREHVIHHAAVPYVTSVPLRLELRAAAVKRAAPEGVQIATFYRGVEKRRSGADQGDTADWAHDDYADADWGDHY
jgi:hypothetical protein